MREASEERFGTRISDICMKHINYPQDIDERIFPTFEKIDKLYNAFSNFKDPLRPSKSKLDDFIRCMRQLESHQIEYNEIFIKVLKDVNKLFIDFVISLDRTQFHVKIFLHYISDEMRINGILRIKVNKTVKDTVTEAAIIADTYKDGHIGRGTGKDVGIGFLSFAILVIVFILYKYTSYFSFLQSRIGKLRKVLKKNNKNNLEFMDIFGAKYKNSIDDSYRIAYISVKYRY
ncbi:variable surface protein [Plasmodium gonderi]|uniref:Variable surface protein n=1 Tax=Plasmodium gonderi TaxID=77519 RepID=A0A1Y1JN61_PLAGO|nr:variable surface protein [Plasmodium gonderi]GAW83919.1 variable surface protein [Plasmodium gonderi]